MIAIGKIGTKIFESRLLGIIESKMWELTPWGNQDSDFSNLSSKDKR